jgi:hypothetical protein
LQTKYSFATLECSCFFHHRHHHHHHSKHEPVRGRMSTTWAPQWRAISKRCWQASRLTLIERAAAAPTLDSSNTLERPLKPSILLPSVSGHRRSERTVQRCAPTTGSERRTTLALGSEFLRRKQATERATERTDKAHTAWRRSPAIYNRFSRRSKDQTTTTMSPDGPGSSLAPCALTWHTTLVVRDPKPGRGGCCCCCWRRFT